MGFPLLQHRAYVATVHNRGGSALCTWSLTLGALSRALCALLALSNAQGALLSRTFVVHCRDISHMSRQGKSHVPGFSIATEILYHDRLLKAFCHDRESRNMGFPLSRHRAYVAIVNDQGVWRQSALGARPSYFLSCRDRKL